MNGMLRFAALAAIVLGAAACSSGGDAVGTISGGGGPGGGGDFGATQGGVQDMAFARELVGEGRVPPPEAFVVEAMFSEHDLPLEGATCATTLCLRAAMGVASDASGEPAAWVQVGMSSTIDPETFQRPSLAVVATVDVSGSMGWSYGSNATSPGGITRALLHEIAGQLDDGDRVAMVTYGSTSSQVLGWTAGGSPAITQAIDALREGGSTNMEAGLQLAYSVAGQAVGTADEVRVMLFTDVQPNVGATTASQFQQMAADGAEQGVGLTVFGVGLGMGAEVMKGMSQLRGGNAFSLMTSEDVPQLMEESWPWMVSPIAYDLHVSAQPSSPLTVARAYGFPGDTPELDVATVFLSKKRGGLLVELAPDDGVVDHERVLVALGYTTKQGERIGDSLVTGYADVPLDQNGNYLPQVGLSRAVPLALLVTAMHDAAEQYADDAPAAIATLEAALERFGREAQGDPELAAEAEFWPELLKLMRAGAPQGDMYPQ